MDKQEWGDICAETLTRMMEHVDPFITPIYKYKEENDIILHGTASYIEYKDDYFIISNDHVAQENLYYHFTHSFKNNENIYNIKNHFLSKIYPIDVSINKVDKHLWCKEHTSGRAIPLERFSSKHDPVKEELLFFYGLQWRKI